MPATTAFKGGVNKCSCQRVIATTEILLRTRFFKSKSHLKFGVHTLPLRMWQSLPGRNVQFQSNAQAFKGSKSDLAVSHFCILYIIEYGSGILFILVSILNWEPGHQHKIQRSFLPLSSPLSGLSLPAILATSRTYHVHTGWVLNTLLSIESWKC